MAEGVKRLKAIKSTDLYKETIGPLRNSKEEWEKRRAHFYFLNETFGFTDFSLQFLRDQNEK